MFSYRDTLLRLVSHSFRSLSFSLSFTGPFNDSFTQSPLHSLVRLVVPDASFAALSLPLALAPTYNKPDLE